MFNLKIINGEKRIMPQVKNRIVYSLLALSCTMCVVGCSNNNSKNNLVKLDFDSDAIYHKPSFTVSPNDETISQKYDYYIKKIIDDKSGVGYTEIYQYNLDELGRVSSSIEAIYNLIEEEAYIDTLDDLSVLQENGDFHTINYYSYDEMNRVTEVIHYDRFYSHENPEDKYIYDYSSDNSRTMRVFEYSDDEINDNRTSVAYYDENNNIIKNKDGKIYEYEYDDEKNIVKEFIIRTDPDHIHTFTDDYQKMFDYDRGKLVAEYFIGNDGERDDEYFSYNYDKKGNLVSITSRSNSEKGEGRIIEYKYDEEGNLVEENQGDKTVIYTYYSYSE